MYDIMNYRNEDGVNKYVRVGTWDGEKVNGTIKSKLMLLENVTWHPGLSRSPPTSYCAEKCDSQREIFVKFRKLDFKCCWKCKKCQKLQIVQNNTCVDGQLGWMPNTNRTGWVKRKLVYPKWEDGIAVAFIVLSFVLLVLTMFTFAFYIKYKQNRLVKASGIELCFVMLTGVALCPVASALFIAKPSLYVCNARSLMGGLSSVMCYAPLFMKVNRIYRIFTHAKTSVTRPPFVSPRTQLLITFALVGVQVMFTLLASILNPVQPSEIYISTREELLLECNVDEVGFALNLSYVMLLMLLCTVYACKTRNFPRNYNESKFIVLTMYATCAVWTAYFPVYYQTFHSVANVYLSSASFLLVGFVSLVGLFGQKVFIVLCVTDDSEESLGWSQRNGGTIVVQSLDDDEAK